MFLNILLVFGAAGHTPVSLVPSTLVARADEVIE
jgi:hypothetical protein